MGWKEYKITTAEGKTETHRIEMPPKKEEMKSFQVTQEHWASALQYYREHRDDLIKAAVFSRKNAISHRNPPFKVGCAVLGIEPDLPGGNYGVYQSYNFKPFNVPVAGDDKRCAERNALNLARRSAKVVAAIVTVSKETSTGDTTKAHDALHPCRECRDLFRALLDEGFLREDTMICNANDGDGELKVEERTLRELLDLYADYR